MKKLLAAMFVALLMVGCGEDTKKPAGDSPESNQSSAEIPPDKTAEVAKVVVDGDELEERDGLDRLALGIRPLVGFTIKRGED